MNLEEKELSSRLIFDGKVVHLCEDRVQLPDGKTASREYVKHVGAVCVLALTDTGEVVLERQFRYPFHRELIEIPAGKLDSADEDPMQAALRELREETGAVCETLTHIGDFVPSPAILGEVISMYIAEGLSIGETDPDDDEFIDVEAIPLDRLAEMCVSGEITDGKTISAVLKAKYLLDKRKQ